MASAKEQSLLGVDGETLEDNNAQNNKGEPAESSSTCFLIVISLIIGFIASPCTFSYHAPAGLSLSLEEEYDITASRMSLIMTLYSIPNALVLLIAPGVMVVFGWKRVTLALLLLVGAGSAIMAAAPSMSSDPNNRYYLFYAGSFVKGIGSESLYPFMTTTINYWFPDSLPAMSTAMAVYQLCGSAGAFISMEPLASATSTSFALWFIVIYVGIATLFLFALAIMEAANKDWFHKYRKDALPLRLFPGAVFFCGCSYEEYPAEDKSIQEPVQTGCLWGVLDMYTWENISSFPTAFWVQVITGPFWIVTVMYTCANFFPFFLEDKFGMSETEAGYCSAMLYITFGVLNLAQFSMLLEKVGNYVLIQLVSCLICAGAFLLLYFTRVTPWFLIPLIGACFGALEPTNAIILQKVNSNLPDGMAEVGDGILCMFLNLGLAIISPVVGAINSATDTYDYQNFLFAGWLGMGVLGSLFLLCVDDMSAPAAEADEVDEEYAPSTETDKPWFRGRAPRQGLKRTLSAGKYGGSWFHKPEIKG